MVRDIYLLSKDGMKQSSAILGHCMGVVSSYYSSVGLAPNKVIPRYLSGQCARVIFNLLIASIPGNFLLHPLSLD